MNKNKIAVILTLLILSNIFTGGHVWAQAKEATPATERTVITGINVTDNALEIKGTRHFAYTIVRSSDPFRYVLEIPDATIGISRDTLKSNSSLFTEITPSQVDAPRITARFEILLQSPSDIEPLYIDNTLILKAKESEANVQEASSEPDSTEPAEALTENKEKESPGHDQEGQKTDEKETLPKATEITDIHFEQTDSVIKIIVKGNGSMSPSVYTLKNRIVLDFPDVAMKAAIPSTVISPVKGMRSGKYKDNARLVIDANELKDLDISSVKDIVIISLGSPELAVSAKKEEAPKPQPEEKKETAIQKPPAEEPAESKEPELLVEGKYTGKKISLDFQDAEIVPILRLLADISGYNVVVNPDVKGKLTMKLINVPWDQALDIILKTFSLGKVVEGNILRIAPLTVMARESKERGEAMAAEVTAEPLQTKVFPISYADVAVVEAAIKNSKLLTARGNISVDKRTSSMVIKDAPSVFPNIENLLATLDKPIPQVMIETRIVEVTTNDTYELGIRWGLNINPVNTLSSLGGLPALGKGAFTGNNYLVDFPASAAQSGAGSGFNFGIINPAKTLGLDLQLSALESLGKSKTISNPRIVTTDNEKALIKQGTSEPIPKTDPQSGQISTDYKEVVLSTEVTPHITPDGSVSMLVNVKKEDILGTVRIGGSDVPRTSKIEGNTKVLVQNGETLVIGGVYKKKEGNTTSGVPGLMNIPLLGWLFKNKSNKEETTELLIFITPRIIETKKAIKD